MYLTEVVGKVGERKAFGLAVELVGGVDHFAMDRDGGLAKAQCQRQTFRKGGVGRSIRSLLNNVGFGHHVQQDAQGRNESRQDRGLGLGAVDRVQWSLQGHVRHDQTRRAPAGVLHRAFKCVLLASQLDVLAETEHHLSALQRTNLSRRIRQQEPLVQLIDNEHVEQTLRRKVVSNVLAIGLAHASHEQLERSFFLGQWTTTFAFQRWCGVFLVLSIHRRRCRHRRLFVQGEAVVVMQKRSNERFEVLIGGIVFPRILAAFARLELLIAPDWVEKKK